MYALEIGRVKSVHGGEDSYCLKPKTQWSLFDFKGECKTKPVIHNALTPIVIDPCERFIEHEMLRMGKDELVARTYQVAPKKEEPVSAVDASLITELYS
jgi:hypothetical protein